jgi:hypothetical protein
VTTSGINPLAFANVTLAQLQAACQQASDLADGWGFRVRYGNNTPVLLAWDTATTLMTAKLAAAIALGARGYNPAAGADNIVQVFWNQAEDYFKGIGHQSITPNVTPNVTMNQNAGPDLPQVSTQPQRGWQPNCGGTPRVS